MFCASICPSYGLVSSRFSFGAPFTFIAQFIKFFVREMLNPDKCILSGADSHEFIELDLDSGAIAILRVLNQENHEKGNNGGPGIDDELPSIRVTKYRPCDRPDNDHANRQHERESSACRPRGGIGRIGKNMIGALNARMLHFKIITCASTERSLNCGSGHGSYGGVVIPSEPLSQNDAQNRLFIGSRCSSRSFAWCQAAA